MNLSLGIVGLPNVGKSTLFTALTKKQVDAANFPFTTISPNVGVVPVPDSRLAKLAELDHSAKVTPAVVEFVDIAGLVKGAHKGEGLGNQFLANIREVAVIVEVVRDFQNPDVIHVAGQVSPDDDRVTIDLELAYADLATVQKRYAGVVKIASTGDKEAKATVAVLDKVKAALDAGHGAREVELSADEEERIRDLQLLTRKPILYLLNTDEARVGDPPPDDHTLRLSAVMEANLAGLPDADVREYLREYGLAETGLERLIRKGYELLDLISYFTEGPDETRAWTIRRGTKAPQAAGEIHTDFERGFIRAEVIQTDDLLTIGSWNAAREQGKIRTEGKEYVFQDGDVVFFHTN